MVVVYEDLLFFFFFCYFLASQDFIYLQFLWIFLFLFFFDFILYAVVYTSSTYNVLCVSMSFNINTLERECDTQKRKKKTTSVSYTRMSMVQYDQYGGRVGFMRFPSSLWLFWDVDYVVRVSMCEMHYGFITSITHTHIHTHTTTKYNSYNPVLWCIVAQCQHKTAKQINFTIISLRLFYLHCLFCYFFHNIQPYGIVKVYIHTYIYTPLLS